MTQEELMQKNPQWLYRIVMMCKALGEMAKHDRERIWEYHWFNKPATMEKYNDTPTEPNVFPVTITTGLMMSKPISPILANPSKRL